jgi:hypothetical protein
MYLACYGLELDQRSQLTQWLDLYHFDEIDGTPSQNKAMTIFICR